MEISDSILYLLDLKLGNDLSERLRDHFIAVLQGSSELATIGGKINLSVLARTLKCDRQLFYFGRGNIEIYQLVTWANLNIAPVLNVIPQQNTKPNPSRSRYKGAYRKLTIENTKLKNDILKLSYIEDCLLSGKIISLPPC
jgi:hypothetical protein